MKIALVLFAALACLPASIHAQTDAEQLATISRPGFGKHGTTVKRFEFLLSEFERSCKNEEGAASFADRLVFVYQRIGETGLDEGLLDLANMLHRITTDYVAILGRDVPNLCTELWSMYMMRRTTGGRLPSEAREELMAMTALFRP